LTVRLETTPSIKVSALHDYACRIKQLLAIEDRDFDLCFVEDTTIRELNATYRGEPRSTDVLSFPWSSSEGTRTPEVESRGNGVMLEYELPDSARSEFQGFLGDIVISVPAARRNAEAEGHSTAAEIRMLILHGVLHLLGYDHETDRGEMTAKELALRRELEGPGKRQVTAPLKLASQASKRVRRQRDPRSRS
jgi:probable rRNA maturation factor